MILVESSGWLQVHRTAQGEIDAQDHALAVVITVTKKTSISLVAVESGYPGRRRARSDDRPIIALQSALVGHPRVNASPSRIFDCVSFDRASIVWIT